MLVALIYRCKCSLAALGILLAAALLVPPWTTTLVPSIGSPPITVALGFFPVFHPPPLPLYGTSDQVDGVRLALTLSAVLVVCLAAGAIEYAITTLRHSRRGGFAVVAA